MSSIGKCQADGQMTALKPGTKRYAVVRAILDSGAEGLDCFGAVRVAHDFVLRSTVSEVQSHYGLAISRRPHVVANSFGGETHCVRYWIEGPERDRAARLLGDLRAGVTLH